MFDQVVPGVGLVAAVLFLAGFLQQRRAVDPPDCAGAKAMDGFGPELVPVASKRRDIDGPAAKRPEAAVAGLVAQISVRVHGAGEHALAWHLDGVAAVGRTEAVGGAGQERLDAGDFGAADGVELGDFHDPHPLHVDRGILGPQFGQLVGEPFLASQHLDRGGFARALRPLEDQHVVGLHAGSVDAGDG